MIRHLLNILIGLLTVWFVVQAIPALRQINGGMP